MMRGGRGVEGGDVSWINRAIKIFYSSLFFVHAKCMHASGTKWNGTKESE